MVIILVWYHGNHHDKETNFFSRNLPSFEIIPSFEYDSELHSKSRPSLLDGCFHIFLDVGANFGITTRKLFEPQLYPGANFSKLFDKVFGPFEERKQKLRSDPKYVCAVGFEPNPMIAPILENMEKSYRKCGWNVYFFKKTALFDQKGNITFYKGSQNSNTQALDRVGNVFGKSYSRTVNSVGDESSVASIRLSDFMRDYVINREPNERQSMMGEQPKILMKMDTESAEVEIFYDLIINGLMTKINYMTVEYHHKAIVNAVRAQRSRNLEAFLSELTIYCAQTKKDGGKYCDFEVHSEEDESYFKSKFDLPICDTAQKL